MKRKTVSFALSLALILTLMPTTAALAEDSPAGSPTATPVPTETALQTEDPSGTAAGTDPSSEPSAADAADAGDPSPAPADSADPYAFLTFTAVADGLALTACDAQTAAVEIPAVYNGQPVTEIADAAFAGCENLTVVTVSEGVLRIGSRAFAGLPQLASVTLPASLTSIREDAFAECPLLTSISAPAGSTAAGFAAAYADALSAGEASDSPADDSISAQTVPAVDAYIALSGINDQSTMYVGQTVRLTAAVSSSDAKLNKTIVWTSSNSGALSVSSTGVIRANHIPTADEGGNPVIITAELKYPPTETPVRSQVVVTIAPRLTSLSSAELEGGLKLDFNKDYPYAPENIIFHVTVSEDAQALYTVKSTNWKIFNIYQWDETGKYEILLSGQTGTAYVVISSTDGTGLVKRYPVTVYRGVTGVHALNAAPEKLRAGQTYTPKLVYEPAKADIASVVWEGSNEYASVDKKTGRITANSKITSKGTVTATATVTDLGGNVRTCSVGPIEIWPNLATVSAVTGPLSIAAGKSVAYTVTYEAPNVAPTSANPLIWKLEASSDMGATYTPADPAAVGKIVNGRVTLVSKVDTSLLLRVSVYSKAQGEANAQSLEAISITDAETAAEPLVLDIAGNCHNGADWDLSNTSAYYVDVSASAEVKWKVTGAAIDASQGSSTTAIFIDPTNSNGKTVTVSATAIDGSGRTATKRFKVCTSPVSAVLLPNPITMGIGKTYTPKIRFYPDTVSKSECTVKWSAIYHGPDGDVDAVQAGYIRLNQTTGSVTLLKHLNRYSVFLNGEYTKCSGSGYTPASVSIGIDETAAPLSSLTVTSEGNRRYLNLNGPSTKTLQLTAAAKPAGTSQIVDWSSSDEGIATVNDNGLVTAVHTGTVTITVKSHDSSQRTSSIRLSVVEGPSAIELNLSTGGNTNALKGVLAQIAWNPVGAFRSPIIWTRKKGEPNAEHPAVLTVNKYGQVIASRSGSSTGVGTATIVATSAVDPTISAETTVTVYDHPQITSIKLMQNGAEYTKDYIRIGKDDLSAFTLDVTTVPDRENIYGISSDSSVAGIINHLGALGPVAPIDVIIGKHPGTVRLTASMNMWPKATASIVLRVVRSVEGVTISSKPDRLTSGTSFNLKADVTPADATYPELEWTVDNPAAVIDKNGVLTAGTVTTPTLVTVTATSTESLDESGRNGISASFSFYIDPAD